MVVARQLRVSGGGQYRRRYRSRRFSTQCRRGHANRRRDNRQAARRRTSLRHRRPARAVPSFRARLARGLLQRRGVRDGDRQRLFAVVGPAGVSLGLRYRSLVCRARADRGADRAGGRQPCPLPELPRDDDRFPASVGPARIGARRLLHRPDDRAPLRHLRDVESARRRRGRIGLAEGSFGMRARTDAGSGAGRARRAGRIRGTALCLAAANGIRPHLARRFALAGLAAAASWLAVPAAAGPDSGMALDARSAAAIERFEELVPARYFAEAWGYAVLPAVKRVGLGLGAAWGRGKVVE